MTRKKKRIKLFILFLAIFFIGGYFLITYNLNQEMEKRYNELNSPLVKDRNGEIIAIQPNSQGYYSIFLNDIPSDFKEIAIKKEDKYFYIHPGFNPFSVFRAIGGYIGIYNSKASSTITQQLAKILLKNEGQRSLKNKVVEFFYALSLETYKSKEEILKMYLNSVYLGNRVQGINLASRYYFNLAPDITPKPQIIQLFAAIQSPSNLNPAKEINIELSKELSKRLGVDADSSVFIDPKMASQNARNFSLTKESYFEASSFIAPSFKKCQLSIDSSLNEHIREIVNKNIENFSQSGAYNAAAVVIKIPENELLAIIGSPDPSYNYFSYKINMALEPRQVGSVFKPFIYLKGFEMGLRPYTLIDDREYKYLTQIGFPLYPRNYDYQYNGEVSLHYALSNSLNVPTLKVLEYIGLEEFYEFIKEGLKYQPPQNLETYQMGIALGTLEMSLFDLTKYFTIFPNGGKLSNIKVVKNGDCVKNQNSLNEYHQLTNEKYIELINKILSDRKTAIDQFGFKSNLNLPYDNYSLKTGTSRNFKDSWIVGYTPDFLVGVWVGNADQTPTKELSGQKGAGIIWSEIMQLIFNSNYNKMTPFKFNSVKKFQLEDSEVYGLSNDDFSEKLMLLKNEDKNLIVFPHDEDIFIFEPGMKISLKSKESVLWYIDGKLVGEGKEHIFAPLRKGIYIIKAKSANKQEDIIIKIQQ